MKLFKSLILTIILGLGLQANLLASTKGVAKAIILKGVVKAYNPATKEKVTLKRGSWVQEGFMVKTENKSFVKFLFIDKSQMNLGPKSQMAITKFPKKKAGIITLMKGSLRSKVTKNYLDIKDKNKSKLFIKTKTAAMGVRGTDFLVTYNPINQNTALVTFSGAVAMAQLSAAIRNVKSNQRALERIVSSDKAVIVKKGQFSGVSPGKTSRATIPVKINPAQLDSMKANDGTKSADDQSSTKTKDAPKKKFRSIIPPGVNSKKFANDAKVDSQVQKVIGFSATKEISDKFAKGQATSDAPPPEGFVNKSTGEIAPVAGGYVDVATAQYIAPPAGSAFDAATQTFIPPTDMGGFNQATGNYEHQQFTLTPDGKFIPITEGPGRQPASTTPDGSPIAPPPELAPIDEPLAPDFGGENPEFIEGGDPNFPEGDSVGDALEDEILDAQAEIDQSIQEATDSRNEILNGNTRVQFNINNSN